MIKKIVGGITFLAIAAVVAFNVNLNISPNSNLSNLSLANVEALAGENNNEGSSCSVEWAANIKGQVLKLSCSANCAKGQLAQCKQNDCKCVQQV